LLILTGDNRLLQYSLSWGLSWAAFDTGLAHVNANLVRPFAGKLYVLDLEQGQVWRFPFSSDGFGPPEGYFSAAAPDLSRAVDMTIDGAVYILLDDGRIYKFLAGESLPFQPDGLPQPLQRPVALVSEGDATSGALYVADAGTRSIVALTKSGEFIHQIRAPVSPDGAAESDTLAGLEVVALEQTGRTLYVLAGGRLYALALPALPEVAGTSE
jgi:outer membrane protein assembly factor BamB